MNDYYHATMYYIMLPAQNITKSITKYASLNNKCISVTLEIYQNKILKDMLVKPGIQPYKSPHAYVIIYPISLPSNCSYVISGHLFNQSTQLQLL